MERGRGGKGEREGWGRPPALLPPLASASNTTLLGSFSFFSVRNFNNNAALYDGRFATTTAFITFQAQSRFVSISSRLRLSSY